MGDDLSSVVDEGILSVRAKKKKSEEAKEGQEEEASEDKSSLDATCWVISPKVVQYGLRMARMMVLGTIQMNLPV